MTESPSKDASWLEACIWRPADRNFATSSLPSADALVCSSRSNSLAAWSQ
jgi:hypothetical protein